MSIGCESDAEEYVFKNIINILNIKKAFIYLFICFRCECETYTKKSTPKCLSSETIYSKKEASVLKQLSSI